MTGFELRTYGIGSDHTTNCATTTAQGIKICFLNICLLLKSEVSLEARNWCDLNVELEEHKMIKRECDRPKGSQFSRFLR